MAAIGSIATVISPGAQKAVPAQPCSSYSGDHTPPQSCISKNGFACSSYDGSAKPLDCLAPSKARAEAAEQKAAGAAAVAAAAADAQDAAAQAAYEAAANRWHRGYTEQDANVYWKWNSEGSCKEYATNGCWHVAVITRDGCPSYVAVNANEYKGGAIVNSLLDNQGFGIPPKTERVFELDADSAGSATASDVQIDCE